MGWLKNDVWGRNGSVWLVAGMHEFEKIIPIHARLPHIGMFFHFSRVLDIDHGEQRGVVMVFISSAGFAKRKSILLSSLIRVHGIFQPTRLCDRDICSGEFPMWGRRLAGSRWLVSSVQSSRATELPALLCLA